VALYRRSSSVLSVQHGIDTVLLDIAHDQYFSLNHVGARCWSLINDGRSTDEIVSTMASECDAADESVRESVTRFLDELVECHLVTIRAE
jgi:hypothetical protein